MMNLPKVGSQVLVTTKHRNYVIGGEPFKYYKTKGTVLQSSNWMNSYEFMVATGEEMRPKAVINVTNVTDIQYLTGSGSNVSTTTRTFKVSSTSSGKTYIVTVSDGKIQCTCTGFSYRKYCKHSQAISAKVSGEKHGN